MARPFGDETWQLQVKVKQGGESEEILELLQRMSIDLGALKSDESLGEEHRIMMNHGELKVF